MVRPSPRAIKKFFLRQAAGAVRDAFGENGAEEVTVGHLLSRRNIVAAAVYRVRDEVLPKELADQYGARCVNTNPEDYVLNIGPIPASRTRSRSSRVVELLRKANARIVAGRGFHRAVIEAIFKDALLLHYLDDDVYAQRVYARAVRLWGKRSARQGVTRSCEALVAWAACRFVPDAYLIDSEASTVVCYEIEDTHPLNHSAILAYGRGWWTLNDIYWDLHVIAYDIYGHPRIYRFPEADLIARAHEEDQAATQPWSRVQPKL